MKKEVIKYRERILPRVLLWIAIIACFCGGVGAFLGDGSVWKGNSWGDGFYVGSIETKIIGFIFILIGVFLFYILKEHRNNEKGKTYLWFDSNTISFCHHSINGVPWNEISSIEFRNPSTLPKDKSNKNRGLIYFVIKNNEKYPMKYMRKDKNEFEIYISPYFTYYESKELFKLLFLCWKTNYIIIDKVRG